MFFRSEPNGWPPRGPTTIPSHLVYDPRRDSLETTRPGPYLSQPDAKADTDDDSSDEEDLPIHESELLSATGRSGVLARLIDRGEYDTFEDVERGCKGDITKQLLASKQVAIVMVLLLSLFLAILGGGLLFLSHQR